MHPLIRNGTRLKEIAEHDAVGIAAWHVHKKEISITCESHDHTRCASLEFYGACHLVTTTFVQNL